MTKIPFNIKYRPQIESGEYRVVTREDRPVEIRIWDLKGDFPVVGVYFDEKNNRETAVQVTAEGRCSIKPSDDYCDDFFITTNKPVMWSKEQIKPVWHEPDEKPSDKSKVVVWTGEEMVQCSYIFGKFKEKTPTEEHGRCVDIGNREDPGSVFISKRSRADLTDLVVKWAYIDDLLNNPDKKEPVSEDLQEEITRYFSKNPIKHLTDWPALKNTALHFANWQRELMMKDAIEVEIIDPGTYTVIKTKDDTVLYGRYGDKVKLLIIKED